MFELLTAVAISAVVAVVLLAAVYIRQVGPGRATRRVRCPDLGRRARLQVLYGEPAWGTLRATEVTRCSLFGPAAVTCAKRCIGQL